MMKSLLNRPILSRSVQSLTDQITNFHPFPTQVRFRWTKAKKKRTIRFKKREALAARGKEIPKPTLYFPVDIPVANAKDKAIVQEEIKKHDEKAQRELAEKMKEQIPVLRHHMNHDLKMSDRVRKLFDLHNGSQSEVVQAQKAKAMKLFELRPGDTGSSAVQVVALTTRIQQLQTHMSLHRKDKHSKRGLDKLYVRRRKVLDYMERKEFDSYRTIVKTLGLMR